MAGQYRGKDFSPFSEVIYKKLKHLLSLTT